MYNISYSSNLSTFILAGVPVEEYVQSVGKLMQVSMKRRLGILKRNKIKTVLFYHIVHGSSTYGFSYDSYEKQGQLPYVMNGCKRFDCFCTDKKDLIPIEEFDAILFHADVLSRNDLPKSKVMAFFTFFGDKNVFCEKLHSLRILIHPKN